MNKLNRFLNRRAANLKAEKDAKQQPTKEIPVDTNPDLTDSQFWSIIENVNCRLKGTESESEIEEIVGKVLISFSDKQVEQFLFKYNNLNS